MAAKVKERDRHIEELVQEVKEQKKIIADLSKAVKVDQTLEAVAIGIPFRSVQALKNGLANSETRKKMLSIAAGIKKNGLFMRHLHERLLHPDLVEVLYTSTRE